MQSTRIEKIKNNDLQFQLFQIDIDISYSLRYDLVFEFVKMTNMNMMAYSHFLDAVLKMGNVNWLRRKKKCRSVSVR